MKVRLGTGTRRMVSMTSVVVLCMALTPAAAGAVVSPKAAPPAPPKPSEKVGNYDLRTARTGAEGAGAPAAPPLAATPNAGVKTLRQQLGAQGIVDVDPLTGTAAAGHPDRRLPDRAEQGRRHDHRAGLRAGPHRRLRPQRGPGQRPDPAQQLRRRRGHHPPELRPAGRRRHGLRQRPQGPRRQGRPADPGRRLAGGEPAGQRRRPAAHRRRGPRQGRRRRVRHVEGAPSPRPARRRQPRDRRSPAATRPSSSLFQTLGGPRLALADGHHEGGLPPRHRRAVRPHPVPAEHRQPRQRDAPGTTTRARPRAASQETRQPDRARLAAEQLAAPGRQRRARLPRRQRRQRGQRRRGGAAERQQVVRLPVHPRSTGPGCVPPSFVCSWDPDGAVLVADQRATRTPRRCFYFLGKFHDHLRPAPIGFTRAAGNFEAVDGDAVAGQRARRRQHRQRPARRQPHRQRQHGHAAGRHPAADADVPVPPARHRVPGRGPVHAGQRRRRGRHRLPRVHPRPVQPPGRRRQRRLDARRHPGRLDGRGVERLVRARTSWSTRASCKDTNAAGELRVGQYVGAGQRPDPHPADRLPGRQHLGRPAPARPAPGPGGYTYGDFGQISGGPEVHADGEIWGETLWDLRKALGSKTAESLVTRAMELSPANPSFLDMRNSILPADLVVNGGKNADQDLAGLRRTAAWAGSPARSTATTPRRSRTSRMPPAAEHADRRR